MPKRWCRSIRRSCPIRQTNLGLVSFRLCHGLLDFSAAVRALIGEVDLRHAPMRLDVPDEHRKPDAARTNDESRLDVVMMNIGWHVGTPHGSIHLSPLTRTPAYAAPPNAIMNSCEHRKNGRTILSRVTDLHNRVVPATKRQLSLHNKGLPSIRLLRPLTSSSPSDRPTADIQRDPREAPGLALPSAASQGSESRRQIGASNRSR